MHKRKVRAVILGAGPAGLTAAYELLQQSEVQPLVVEKNPFVGGLCLTARAGDNLADIGGHRFFTKFSKVHDWWLQFLPLDAPNTTDTFITQNRLSRIYYLRRFFDYPVALNLRTFRGLGLKRMLNIIASYLRAKLHPIKPEKSAEDFLINTFGKVLYRTFFKDYTEKLWGISCREISAEWGRERIRGIHLREIVLSVLKAFRPKIKDTFLYPKYGPAQLWQKVADKVLKQGGEFTFNAEVVRLNTSGDKIISAVIRMADGSEQTIEGDYFISSLPVKDLITMLPNVPQNIRQIAAGLQYRNFRSAVVLLNKMLKTHILPDTWLYIQESDVKIGRIQVYNNWSADLLADRTKVLLALEYFCDDNDNLWQMSDEKFTAMAIAEAEKISLIDDKDVIEAYSFKLEKAYPAYFGSYSQFEQIKNYTDSVKNLYLIGRNGMHKYINMDHAVLSGMAVAENIAHNLQDKENIWNIDNSKYLD
ncbi:MAG: NAD(P)/FAD-dependent oxidoreductase [Alphaproteobacteria bacterium]|nr:NAD(P)/FAD-dependent oxidoreductase [Alphaproteobacteria bacterium]